MWFNRVAPLDFFPFNFIWPIGSNYDSELRGCGAQKKSIHCFRDASFTVLACRHFWLQCITWCYTVGLATRKVGFKAWCSSFAQCIPMYAFQFQKELRTWFLSRISFQRLPLSFCVWDEIFRLTTVFTELTFFQLPYTHFASVCTT